MSQRRKNSIILPTTSSKLRNNINKTSSKLQDNYAEYGGNTYLNTSILQTSTQAYDNNSVKHA